LRVLALPLKQLRDGLIGSAYPDSCRLCGLPIDSVDDGVTCRACWMDPAITRFFSGAVCARCGTPMPGTPMPGALRSSGAQTCGRCDALPFSAARACGAYQGALEANILFLKSQPHLCQRLRAAITETYATHAAALSSDIIIPLPLHPRRERQRGFNQARLIARLIARGFALTLDTRSLVRVKYSERHRAGLDSIDRARSVARAFRVARPDRLQGAAVLLVDDVLTTGSTVAAAATTLLDAGATRVNVITIARAASQFRLRRMN
jgi:ComF family protein